MFLRSSLRKKNGKEHRYWSIVENKRVARGRVVQRHVLYLGEINGSQQEAWQKTIEIFEDGQPRPKTVALLPEADWHPEEVRATTMAGGAEVVRIRLAALELRRPRQWGACWLACQLYEQLGLVAFFAERLPPGRKGTRWDLVLQTLVIYRLIAPGSEWRLHRTWFERSALADLLGADFGLAEIHKLYACHARLLTHKAALFSHLQQRWQDLFNARFDVLLFDLTSTFFECAPPESENAKRRHGYSRDKRPDCVQVVIALVVTPEGFPLAYEVLPGNTSDKTTEEAEGTREAVEAGEPRSFTVGMPSLRTPPSGFAISARSTGAGRYVLARNSSRSAFSHAASFSGSAAMSAISTPSTPATPPLAFTCRHAVSSTSARCTSPYRLQNR
jgi:hypothetical protein